MCILKRKDECLLYSDPDLYDRLFLKLDERYGEFSRVPYESSSPGQVCISSAEA